MAKTKNIKPKAEEKAPASAEIAVVADSPAVEKKRGRGRPKTAAPKQAKEREKVESQSAKPANAKPAAAIAPKPEKQVKKPLTFSEPQKPQIKAETIVFKHAPSSPRKNEEKALEPEKKLKQKEIKVKPATVPAAPAEIKKEIIEFREEAPAQDYKPHKKDRRDKFRKNKKYDVKAEFKQEEKKERQIEPKPEVLKADKPAAEPQPKKVEVTKEDIVFQDEKKERPKPGRHKRNQRLNKRKEIDNKKVEETLAAFPEPAAAAVEERQDAVPQGEAAAGESRKEKRRRSWRERNERRKQKKLEMKLKMEEASASEIAPLPELQKETAPEKPAIVKKSDEAAKEPEIVSKDIEAVKQKLNFKKKDKKHAEKHKDEAKFEITHDNKREKKHDKPKDKDHKKREPRRREDQDYEVPQEIIDIIEDADVAPVVRKKKNNYYENYEEIPINKEKLLTRKEQLETFYLKLFREVENHLKNNMLVDEGVQIVLAVSGGVDSVVMMDIMANLASRNRFQLIAAHYNHNLRGDESIEDEAYVRKLAEDYNIRYFSSSGKVKQFAEKNKLSLEVAGRQLRYKFFERVAQSIKANFVATAHNADDTAETMLLNLLRGSGLTGLSGIPQKRVLNKNIKIIRPLIGIRKSKLIDYANKRGLKWREDSSNLSKDFTRNKVRNELLPHLKQEYNPAIVDTLKRTARLLNGADEFIRTYVRKSLENLITTRSSSMFSINIPYFETFSDFIQGEILQYSLNKFLSAPILTMNAIDRILDLRRSETGATYNIDENFVAIRDRNELTFAKYEDVPEINELIDKEGEYQFGNLKLRLTEISRDELRFTKNPKVEYFDADLIPPQLELRNWKAGDYFQPYGMDGTVKVGDFLTNYKISLLNRKKVLVLKTEEEIIWLVGHRISELFKVTENTKRILKAELAE